MFQQLLQHPSAPDPHCLNPQLLLTPNAPTLDALYLHCPVLLQLQPLATPAPHCPSTCLSQPTHPLSRSLTLSLENSSYHSEYLGDLQDI